MVEKKKGNGAASGPGRQDFHLQFVTVPTADTPGTGMTMNFDRESYFFGQLSEGFQRACIQRGVGMRKMGKFFLTGQTDWNTYGGLLGQILSLADVNARIEDNNPEGTTRDRLHIHTAPKGLHVFACARRFIFRTSMPLTVHENKGLEFKWQDEPTYSDENIRVWSIPLRAENPGLSSTNTTMNGANDHPTFNSPSPAVEQDQSFRKKVVSDMFESDWRRDKLFERPFQEVKMPATIWLRNSETKELQGTRCVSHDDAPHITPEQIVLVRDPWPASLVGELPDASSLPSGVSMSYIVKGYDQRGTFDPTKAKSLGIKPGPIYRELSEGGTHILEDGTVVTSEMVMGPVREGKGIAFFDLPTRSYLSSLQEVLNTRPEAMFEGISAMVWILGPGVSSGQVFDNILTSLPTFKHIVSDVDQLPNPPAFESVALSTLWPARVAPAHFPAIKYSNTAPYRSQKSVSATIYTSPLTDGQGISLAKAGVKVTVQPRYSVDESEAPPPFGVEHIADEKLAQTLKTLQVSQKQSSPLSMKINEPEIVTLGTGSAMPSKYRNVSATLLRMPGDQGNYLFDCGENTFGQLQRTYSAAELEGVLRNLRGIWISHLHADHHLGTIGVLQGRAKAFGNTAPKTDRTIYLVSEPNMLDFIREYASVEPSLLTKTGLVPIVCSQNEGTSLNGEPFDFESTNSAIRNIKSVRVSHCAGAQAVSMTFKDGFKISYSGDCRPSGHFCRIGRDSDVLIHEATFDNDMEGDAIAKRHCTTAEALGVAMNMRAKNVVLTHFSQRYHKIPNFGNVKLPNEMRFEEVNVAEEEEEGPVDDGVLPSSTAAVSQSSPNQRVPTTTTWTPHQPRKSANQLNIAVAFDYMRFKVSEIAGLKEFYPRIQSLFDQQARQAIAEREERTKKMEEETERKKLKAFGGSGGGAQKNLKKESRKEKRERSRERASAAQNGENPHHHEVDEMVRAESLQTQHISKNALKRQAKQEATMEKVTGKRRRSQGRGEDGALREGDGEAEAVQTTSL